MVRLLWFYGENKAMEVEMDSEHLVIPLFPFSRFQEISADIHKILLLFVTCTKNG
jgi:hypothetical protein